MKNIPVKCSDNSEQWIQLLNYLNMLRLPRTSSQKNMTGGFGVGFMGQPIGILSFITNVNTGLERGEKNSICTTILQTAGRTSLRW